MDARSKHALPDEASHIADLAPATTGQVENLETAIRQTYGEVFAVQKQYEEMLGPHMETFVQIARVAHRTAEAIQPVLNMVNEHRDMFSKIAEIAAARARLVEEIKPFARQIQDMRDSWTATTFEPRVDLRPVLLQPEIDYERLARMTTDIVIERERHNKENARPARMLPFPADLRWEEITFKFKDGHEVDIFYRDERVPANYAQMGFRDERMSIPNKQWALLQLLAMRKGELSWDDPESKPGLQKKKERLAKALCGFFGIADDPFHPYHESKSYKLKFTIIAAPGSSLARARAEINEPAEQRLDDDPLGIHESLRETGRSVYSGESLDD
jgi:hypothetical protein